ncbi:unnamed protein product [Dracunculus medinensis]|uniref:C3H1-type domain-containing protein n=1 Tax=Dracunculus medinensis TaxID=318479 RepID=A0A0N4U931_DRAME|nr:unnamed protein product [Dracunculus medinensis]
MRNYSESTALELHDSCYSSCSEESHNSLSRKPSDTLNYNFAKFTVADDHLVEFATKLGYTENQLKIVLKKLGANAGQDQILSELIKLGRMPNNSNLKFTNICVGDTKPSLRSIVIDGSNIAMTHGRKEIFSCGGIRECVRFFRDRGHKDILVFVPQFRREAARSDCPISDQHILFELEQQNILTWTPSRRIGGRHIVCHDDRYILKTAEEKDAVIVSNDEYRDLIKENPQYRKLVEQRLLMYSFVDGRFVPPDDPLGRHGPKLAQFLSSGNHGSFAQLCPYARKCTYGNKCKYYHPERPFGHISVTDRLIQEKQQRKQCLSALKDKKRAPIVLATKQSAGNANANSTQDQSMCKLILGTVLANFFMIRLMKGNSSTSHPYQENNHFNVTRTQSLNIPNDCEIVQNDFTMCHNNSQNLFDTATKQSAGNANANSTQDQSMCKLTSQIPIVHESLSRNLSAPNHHSPHFGSTFIFPEFNRSTSYSNMHDPYDQSQLLSIVRYTDVQNMTRNGQFNTICTPNHFTSSTAIWGDPELSVSPIIQSSSEWTTVADDDRRTRLHHLLCQLFSEATVIAVMSANPQENDVKRLCARIIEMQKGFEL